MTMHRTLALVGALSLGVLLIPAEASPLAESASRSDASVSLLDRPAAFADVLPPAVAKQIDPAEVDLASVRLATTDNSAQIFVAQGKRGLCLIRVDDPTAGGFAYTCSSTVAAGGVYLEHIDRTAGTMQLTDIVPDSVTRATIDGKPAEVAGNVLVADNVPLGASVTLAGTDGIQNLPMPAQGTAVPQASG
jgi:hypothetical protein